MSEKKEYNDNTTDSPRSEKPKRIEEKIAERRAYNFLVHQAEAKLWMGLFYTFFDQIFLF